METVRLAKKLTAEFLGTAAIVATVVGTGHMVESLGSDATVGLILMALAVGAVLFVAISILMPISGAHFNPAVTIILGLEKRISLLSGTAYIASQILGAVSGAAIGNLMFNQALFSANAGSRLNPGAMLGEVIATFGLVLLILMLIRQNRVSLIAPAVALWIIAGHFFTSSTSFANPAVTIGRSFTNTLTGIDLPSVLSFIPMQILGALAGLLAFKYLFPKNKEPSV